jgi:hypothetical protein
MLCGKKCFTAQTYLIFPVLSCHCLLLFSYSNHLNKKPTRIQELVGALIFYYRGLQVHTFERPFFPFYFFF